MISTLPVSITSQHIKNLFINFNKILDDFTLDGFRVVYFKELAISMSL